MKDDDLQNSADWESRNLPQFNVQEQVSDHFCQQLRRSHRSHPSKTSEDVKNEEIIEKMRSSLISRHSKDKIRPLHLAMAAKMEEFCPDMWRNVPLPITESFKTMQNAIVEL